MSPALFSVFGPQILHALFYAVDVCLLAETESDLQNIKCLISLILLHADGNWEFNSAKSKFVVVGKRTDKHKQWSLGNDKIGEDNNYQYFGAYFSRSLRPNYHITKYLKENIEKKVW